MTPNLFYAPICLNQGIQSKIIEFRVLFELNREVAMSKSQNESKHAKQERLILDVMSKLSEEHPTFYYLSTIEVAVEIEKYIAEPGHLSVEQKQLLSGLDRHAIQMLLSLHSNQSHFKS